MRRFLAALLMLILVLAAAACGDDTDAVTADPDDPSTSTRPSVAGDWILQSLTVDGAAIPLPEGELEITIALGEISGNLGCNSFFGDFDAADDGTLSVSSLGQTEMACEDRSRMDFEFTYGQALPSATSWSADPDGLTLSGDTVEIRYAQAPPPVHRPLEGTVWEYDTIYSGDGVDRAATNRADMAGVTLVISDGALTVSGPECAGGSGPVEAAGGREGSFSVDSITVPTSPGCEVVAELADLLARSTGFMIDEDRLTFVGEPGETVGFTTMP